MTGIMVYCPCKDENESRHIAKILIDERLVACANIFPITSLYRWKGKVVDDSESVMIVKSVFDKYPIIESRIKELHSYEVPAIIRIDISMNQDYLDWMSGEL